MAFFSKDEIISRAQDLRQSAGGAFRADLNMAILILGSAMNEIRQRSGRDYGEHPLNVGMRNTRSNTKRIIGLLHDVVEDTDWTVDDLRRIGFSARVVAGVDAMTHRDGEAYFDSIERCSLNRDATDRKIEDLSHNMDMSRTEAFVTQKDVDRTDKYKLSRAFLVAVKKGAVKAGATLQEFVSLRADFNDQARTHELLARYSSHAPLRPSL